MPNYIKNRIKLIGNDIDIVALKERFSTHIESYHNTSFKNELTFTDGNNNYGWLNKETCVFTQRNKEPVQGVPVGWEPSMSKSWTRFPDFNKVIPIPEGMDISSDSWIMPLENQFSEHKKFKSHIEKLRKYCKANPEEGNEAIDNMFQGIRNYIEHGHASWYSWSVENWGTKWNSSDCGEEDGFFEFTTAWSGVPNLIEKMHLEFPTVKILYEFSDEDTGCNCGVGIFENGIAEFKKLKNLSVEAYELAFKLKPYLKEHYALIDGKYEHIDEEE